MTDPIRVGIIGCGRVAADAHVPALASLDDAEVVAVADADPARLAAVGDQASVQRRYSDYRQLLDDRDVQVAVIGVPPVLHAEVARAGIAAGKHLLIEKPLAVTLEEADALIALADGSGLRITLGFNLRWHRLMRAAREMIADGTVERPRLVTTAFTSAMGRRDDMPEWRKRRSTGGGVLFEIGVHHFDAWRFLLSTEVEEVFAGTQDDESEDDQAVVTARLADGTLATAVFSQTTSTDNCLDLFANNGRLRLSLYRFDGLEWIPSGAIPGSISRRVQSGLSTLRQLPAGVAAMRGGGDFQAAYRAEWRHFLDCVRSGDEPACSLRDGRQALAVVVAAAESAESGLPVQVR